MCDTWMRRRWTRPAPEHPGDSVLVDAVVARHTSRRILERLGPFALGHGLWRGATGFAFHAALHAHQPIRRGPAAIILRGVPGSVRNPDTPRYCLGSLQWLLFHEGDEA